MNALPKFGQAEHLRAEAAIEPDPVPTAPPTKDTQVIAIYGKGGIGKSFTLANLSYMMAQQGKRVLLIGCDPKSDTTSLLFGGRACPTIIETSARKKLAGDEVGIGDVCFKRDGVFAMELGGPEVGRGCGGRGIIHGFELLEKLGFHEWGFDYVLLDFLGDQAHAIADVAQEQHRLAHRLFFDVGQAEDVRRLVEAGERVLVLAKAQAD